MAFLPLLFMLASTVVLAGTLEDTTSLSTFDTPSPQAPAALSPSSAGNTFRPIRLLNSPPIWNPGPRPLCQLAGLTLSGQGQQLVSNYCSRMAGNTQACPAGDSPEISCGVDCGLSPAHRERILSAIQNLPDHQKSQACQDQVRQILTDEPVSDAEISNTRAARDNNRSLLAAPDSNDSTITNSDRQRCSEVASSGCDEFADTALSQSSFSQFASLFSLDYVTRQRPGVRIFNTRINLPFGENCSTCMRQKYRAIAGVSGVNSSDYSQRVQQEKQDIMLKLAARKANQAIGHYLRFVERNDFLVRFAGLPRKSCPGPAQIPARNCPHARAISEHVRNSLGVSVSSNNPIDVVRGVLEGMTQNTFSRSTSICSRRFEFGNFQLGKLTLVGSEKFSPATWLDAQAEQEIARCPDHHTNCFVNAMASSQLRAINSNPSLRPQNAPVNEETLRAELVAELALSPTLRTLLSSKDGVQEFKQLPTLPDNSNPGTIRAYLQEHQSKFEAAAHVDGEAACRALASDLSLALCTSESNYASNYTTEELRQELGSLIADEKEVVAASPEFFTKLGATCTILSESGRHETGRAASITAADRKVAPVAIAVLPTSPLTGYDNPVDIFSTSVSEVCAGSGIGAPTFAFELRQNRVCREAWETDVALRECTPIDRTLGRVPSFLPNSYTPTNFNFSPTVLPPITPTATLFQGQTVQNDALLSQTPTISGAGARLDEAPTTGVTGTNAQGGNTTDQISVRSLQGQEVLNPNPSESSFFSDQAINAYQFLATNPDGLNQRQVAQTPQALSRPIVHMPTQQIPKIEVPASEMASSIRQEELLSRQELELLRRVEGQSVENTELRNAIAQLRQELRGMASQNAELLPRIQTMLQNKRQPQEQELSEEETLIEEEAAAVVENPVEVRRVTRNPASTTNRGVTTGNAFNFNNESSNRGASIQNSDTKNTPFTAPISNQPTVSVSSSVAVRAPVSTNIGDGQFARAAGNRLVTRFTPSAGVSRQVSGADGEMVAQEVSPEARSQLVIEFLDYVKDYPLYRNGAYITEANDAIKVDVSGREVVVRLSEIPDLQIRRVVHERILVQRITINQQLRQARLVELRRLLAEASDGL